MERDEDDRHRDEERHALPPAHRRAAVDEVRPVESDHRPRPALPERLGIERMEGEGGGSAPMDDAPEDGDLRRRRPREAEA